MKRVDRLHSCSLWQSEVLMTDDLRTKISKKSFAPNPETDEQFVQYYHAIKDSLEV